MKISLFPMAMLSMWKSLLLPLSLLCFGWPALSVNVSLPDTLFMPNSLIEVSVSTTQTTGMGVYSAMTRIVYDPTVLSFNSINRISCITSGWSAVSNNQGNMLSISLFGTQPLQGQGKLVNIKFNTIGQLRSASELHFDLFQFNEGVPNAVTDDGFIFVGPPEPWFEPLGNLAVNQGSPINASVIAHDPLGRDLILSAADLPPGSTFTQTGNGSGLFQWQTTMQDLGVYGLEFVAQNSIGVTGSVATSVTVNEIHAPPNGVLALDSVSQASISWSYTALYGLYPTGFIVSRLQAGQEADETQWSLLTPSPIVQQAFIDTLWSLLPNGTYRWAVKAFYPGSEYSVATLSNSLVRNIRLVSGYVRNGFNQAIPGASVTIGSSQCITNLQGYYATSVIPGIYTLTVNAAGYHVYTQTNMTVPVNTDLEMDVVMQYLTFSVMGRIVENSDTSMGIADVTITLNGIQDFNSLSSVSGYFVVPNVICNNTYQLIASKFGYDDFLGQVALLTSNLDIGSIPLIEHILPPSNAQAVLNNDNTSVLVTWSTPSEVSRSLLGYNVFRMLAGEEGNASLWLQLNTNPVNGLTYTDDSWGQLLCGNYKWAVEALYTGNTTSTASISNSLYKPVKIVGRIVEDGDNNIGIQGAVVNLIGAETFSGVSGNDGEFMISGIIGFSPYSISVTKAGYNPFTDNIVVEGADINLGSLPLTDQINPPINVQASLIDDSTSVFISWQQPQNQYIKALEGYYIWRLNSVDEDNEDDWVLLSIDIITSPDYSDIGWTQLTPGMYKWAIKSVYTGTNTSSASFSNSIEKTQVAVDDEVHPNLCIDSTNAFPSPFKDSVKIEFEINKLCNVEISVYDIRGRFIKRVLCDTKNKGFHMTSWNGTDNAGQKVATGLYLCRVLAGNEIRTLKLLFQK